jgi:hypothetical protein
MEFRDRLGGPVIVNALGVTEDEGHEHGWLESSR